MLRKLWSWIPGTPSRGWGCLWYGCVCNGVRAGSGPLQFNPYLGKPKAAQTLTRPWSRSVWAQISRGCSLPGPNPPAPQDVPGPPGGLSPALLRACWAPPWAHGKLTQAARWMPAADLAFKSKVSEHPGNWQRNLSASCQVNWPKKRSTNARAARGVPGTPSLNTDRPELL